MKRILTSERFALNAPADEFRLIEAIRRRIPAHSAVDLGIGDDAACLAVGDQGRLITTDMLLEGVHFEIPPADPRQIGRKSINVNLSDIAAMGGIPTAAFVSICWPKNRDGKFREDVCLGLEEACARFSVSLAGGDTNSWNGPLVVSVTAVGRLEGPAWTRSGARPGDWIMVTGSLGGSLTGHHLDFVPRVEESRRLREVANPSSMIDISDGLSADLYHLLDESGVGGTLEAEAIPTAVSAQDSSGGRSSLERALGDGEDFELLFTVSPKEGRRLLEHPPFTTRLSRIGEIEAEPGGRLRMESGEVVPLARMGWSHSL